MMCFPWKAVLKLKAATTTKTKLVQKPGPPMLAVKLSLGMSAAARRVKPESRTTRNTKWINSEKGRHQELCHRYIAGFYHLHFIIRNSKGDCLTLNIPSGFASNKTPKECGNLPHGYAAISVVMLRGGKKLVVLLDFRWLYELTIYFRIHKSKTTSKNQKVGFDQGKRQGLTTPQDYQLVRCHLSGPVHFETWESLVFDLKSWRGSYQPQMQTLSVQLGGCGMPLPQVIECVFAASVFL